MQVNLMKGLKRKAMILFLLDSLQPQIKKAIFPYFSLSRVFLDKCIYKLSRPEKDVLAEFLCSLPDMDKEVCQCALSHYESVDEDDLLEVLSTYNTRVMPRKDSIGVVVNEVAQHELIQRTAFISES